MQTLYFQQHEIDSAGEILRQGGCVAFPTETVYGLGADALNATAVAKIFEAKGRPSDNPLIVHVSDLEMLAGLVPHVSSQAEPLIRRFWPGPLTLVLPKSEAVPDCVTAGLPTVAVRMPNHAWALELIQSAQRPIAAPSANRSGLPSGTTWQAVRDDLDGLADAILCGPATEIGLESTVLDLSSNPPRILRPGKVSFAELRPYLPNLIDFKSNVERSSHETLLLNSPGLRHRHYQPKARVILIDYVPSIRDLEDTPSPNSRNLPELVSDAETISKERVVPTQSMFIGLHPNASHRETGSDAYMKVCVPASAEEYATSLFQFFRTADEMGATTIFCQSVPEIGIGAALMDRIRRAAEQ